MVVGSIASEKVASALAVAATPVAPSVGATEPTVGATVSALARSIMLCRYFLVVLSEANTGNPVALLTFCFVEVALLIHVSVLLWIKGVPNPSEKEILDRGVFL